MQRVYNILESILGKSKQGYYDKSITQYQFNCPYCAEEKGGIDNKYNLEISFSLGKYHCWRCNNSGSLSKIIRKYGGREKCDQYFAIINDIKESKYYDLSSYNDKDVVTEEYLKLPQTFTRVGLIKDCPTKLRVYLESRNITQDIVDRFKLGYTTWDEEKWQMRNRLIIPSYNSMGELNYWVGRDYTGNPKKLKYMNCKNDKNKIVYQEDQIQFDADITLVEGAIDAIYGNNTIALLGKVLTRDTDIFRKLYEKANGRIIICLDSDTNINETKRIYNILNRGKLRDKIYYIRLGTKELPYKDYGEIYEAKGKKGIIDATKQMKQFSEIELVF